MPARARVKPAPTGGALGQKEQARFFINLPGSYSSDTRLPDAAMNGDRAVVQSLLQEKVDVNSAQGDGTTALHWAAYRDDLEMAKLLIESGANVKAGTRLGDMTA